MKIKSFSLVLLLLFITIARVRAQNLPAFPGAGSGKLSIWSSSIWTSPQSATTEGRFRSSADDFIRPDAYTGVKFDKLFGLASFQKDIQTGDHYATAGFAARIRDIYIGAFYTGNMWAGTQANNYIEQAFLPEDVPAGGDANIPYNVYDPISVSDAPTNSFAVLVGAADMGFRISYRTNYSSFDQNDIVIKKGTGCQLYNNYRIEEGYIAPQIAWAMAKDLTGNGIRPYATLDLVFYREYEKVNEAGGAISGAKVVNSKNHFDPSIGLGLGGFTFFNEGNFKSSFNVDYALTLNLYDNDFYYVADGVNKTGKIKGTASPGGGGSSGYSYNEEFFMSNSFIPSVSGSWSTDRLSAKFKLNLPLIFTNKENNQMEDPDHSGNLIKSGLSSTSFTFTFRSDLRLALQYKIILDKLTLNAGARIQATALQLETQEQNNYSTSGEFQSSKIAHNNSFGAKNEFLSRFSLGVTFNFQENFWLETIAGVTEDTGVDIFAPGGLFSFGSILIAFKF